MFDNVTYRLVAWWQRQVTIHKLQMLDDRLLEDLGTKRSEIACFVADLDHC
jgi:uncharacterized protein YjiS (DUF1127 family)